MADKLIHSDGAVRLFACAYDSAGDACEFAVEYGKDRFAGLHYAAAFERYGSCVFHQFYLAGKMDKGA